ncbi:patatin-like phospholipase family protein [Pseudoroseicyclus tamaricis]|uniref:Cyclic nucleotide-binding domain-containing protein n=1 Tax=Pseudoroseicyclus tamaricis TaxID=2705421 RepID=A0A6B2JX48_9RHOB|nr:patatin-like phospholipase family protein [Pseudoroseicyclus tamaricis]NDV01239.1 cyclic nucleotide-binding domain-containing protein [Pseudoroseicyclus tamaricis]
MTQFDADSGLLDMLRQSGDGALDTTGDRRSLPRGARLIEAGAEAESLYFVLKGRFEVRVNGRVVAEIVPPQSVGEIAFLTGGTRTADVVAARDSEVLELDRSTFDGLVARAPQINTNLTAWLARRLAAATARLPSLERPVPRVTCMLVPEDTPDIALGALRSMMEAEGPLRVVDSADAAVQSSGAPGAALLDGEDQAPRSLYIARSDSELCRAMVRQSDGVVILGPLAAPRPAEGLSQLAAEMHEPEARRLVLWRNGAEIAGARSWLDTWEVTQHYHLRLDDTEARNEDAARIARFLSGRARGVVMGGGGALGCAHLGVARALAEAGISVDYWGGTSVGGAMAVALASGLEAAEIMDRTDEIFVRNAALSTFAPPVYGLLDAHVFDRQLRLHYGETDLADLPVPVFTAATSLTRNDLHLFRTGPSWEAVRASGSLPMMLPPFIAEDGEVLVDGGLTDNLPLAAMRERKTGPNLVINLTPDQEYRARAPYADLPTRMSTLAHLVTRRRTGVPKLMAVMSRAMVVASRRTMAQTDLGDDVLLALTPVRGIGLMDWKRGREQEASAYAQARAAIEEGALDPFMGHGTGQGTEQVTVQATGQGAGPL